MKSRVWVIALALLVIVAIAAISFTRSTGGKSGQWTPAPITGSMVIGTRAPDLEPLPTVALAAVTPAAVQPPPLALTPAAVQPPAAGSTPDPNLVTITEADVQESIASGATAESGATLEGLAVQFTADGKMIVTASRVGYGFVTAENLVLVGRMVASGGRLQFETESISPRGIVTSLIPSIANQALQQYTSQWTVDEVRTLEGRLELRVRS